MGGSREESPDWLRCFQAPTTHSTLTLSSGSESAHSHDALEKEYEGGVTLKKDEKYGENSKLNVPSCSIWTLSSDSDSESHPPHDSKKEDVTEQEQEVLEKSLTDGAKGKDALPLNICKRTASMKSRKLKPQKEKLDMNDLISKEENSLKGNDYDMKTTEDDIAEKHTEPLACSSRLPLIFSEKVQRSKALVECEGESIEMSGDMGAVGRVVVSETPSGKHDMFLDLKGTVYKTTILPSRTFCIVSLNQSEAKIEAIMNDFIQLKPQSNVFEAETMVEGTLDGFSFDDDDEGEKMPKATTHQGDDDEGTDEKNRRKRKGKALEQNLGSVPKKGKTGGGKPQKKVRKKPQAPKRSKTKK